MLASRVEVVTAGVLIAVYAAGSKAQRPLTPLPAVGQEAIAGEAPGVRQTALEGKARLAVGVDQNSWRELRLWIAVENLTSDLLGVHEIGLAVLDGGRHTISPHSTEALEKRIEQNLDVPSPGPPPTGYDVHSRSTTSDIYGGTIDTSTHGSLTPDLFSQFYWARTAKRYNEAQHGARLAEDNLARLRKRQGDWERPLVPGEIRDGEFWYVPSSSANLSAVRVVVILRDPLSGKAQLLDFRFQGLQPRTH